MDWFDDSIDLTTAEIRKIELAGSQFEKQLLDGQTPTIENILRRENDPRLQRSLLRHLVSLELDSSESGFTHKRLREYVDRFVKDKDVIVDLFQSKELTHLADDRQGTEPNEPTLDIELRLVPGQQFGKYKIIYRVGNGAFGVVYRARDEDLQRDVALKLARIEQPKTKQYKTMFLTEARNSAGIKADGIATIYDLYTEDDKICIVQEFVDGSNLSKVLAERSLTLQESVLLIIEIAHAISFAHENNTYHRDLKPSNVIVDKQGRPTVVDFGLAFPPKKTAGAKTGICGTPNYMSPEQVRGEVYHTDASTDIWSMGVMLYEMLVGCRPFEAKDKRGVLKTIETEQPKSLHDRDPKIPAELNRITMKCLNKRKSNRYSKAQDMVDDLQRFVDAKFQFEEKKVDTESSVIPKGLRAFSGEDSGFFPKLLAGPRDHRGIPESILFWKNRIENLGAFDVFPVGLIYGVSGCGKSSFTLAGLLPMLSPDIKTIYIEADQQETEARLLASLINAFPGLPSNILLPEAVALIRDEDFLATGEKLLVVIDQFEQWLSANRSENESSLVNALRHCDGGCVQSLLITRDDYWAHAGSFMDDLEIPLVQNQNCRVLDLFTCDHAKKVLLEYGRAYSRLDLDELTDQQQIFLERAVAELSEDNRVVCIRLALFVEAFKTKDWTPETLNQLGGAVGVGVRFLDDTFATKNSPQAYRIHYRAAQAVLQALLPLEGSRLKGHTQSRDQLLSVSTYASEPKRFDRLIEILDKDLRLVTSTNSSAGSAEQPETQAEGSVKSYQLSHDYLVPILERWIDTDHQRLFSGRVRIRMSQVASIWGEVPDKRYLPTWIENARFLLFSKWKTWTPLQKKMMKASFSHHLLRTVVGIVLLCCLAIAGTAAIGDYRLDQEISALKQSRLADVDSHIVKLQDHKEDVVPKLKNEMGMLLSAQPVGDAELRAHDSQQLNVAIALTELDSSCVDLVAQGLFTVPLDQLPSVVSFLTPFRHEYINRYADHFESNPTDCSQRAMRMALAMAHWGQPEFLIDFALDASPQTVQSLLPALRVNQDLATVSLEKQVAELRTHVMSNPSESLTRLFGSNNGIVHRLGAMVLTVPLERSSEILNAAFEEGYLPVSFRPYLAQGQPQVAIVWDRNTEFAGGDFQDYIQIQYDMNAKDLAAKTEELEAEWRITDVSFYNDQPDGPTPRYSCVWTKNKKQLKTRVDLNISHQEFTEQCSLNSEEGYQVERLFTRVGDRGKPLYTVVWQKDPEHPVDTLESNCLPEYSFPADQQDRKTPIPLADCQLATIDLSKRYYFEIRELARKAGEKAGCNLISSSTIIPIACSDSVGVFANTLRTLGDVDEARNLYLRLIADHPDWRDADMGFAHLLSVSDNQSELDEEIGRLKNAGVTQGEISILFPLLRLRFAVQQNDLKSAKNIHVSLMSSIQRLKTEYKKNAIILSGLRKSAIRANAVFCRLLIDTAEAQELKDEAVRLLRKSDQSKFRVLISQSDYDTLRDHPGFQELILKNGFGLRVTTSNRLALGILTASVARMSEAEMVVDARKYFEMGFRPRCVSSQFNAATNSVYSQSIWERSGSSNQVANDRFERRLANASLLLAGFGRNSLFQEMVAGKFGKNAQTQLAEFVVANRQRSEHIQTNGN